MRLVLCQLYPEHLSIYADRGNVMVLRKRCAWRGIELVERPLRPGEQLDASEIDLYLLGGGQDRDQLLIADDLLRHRPELERSLAGGATMIGVCGGYQLLGHVYRGHHGDELRGLGLLDLETNAGTTRMIGNVLLACDLGDGPRTLVGFENHAGRTTLGPGLAPLGRVLAGNGNDGASGFEGARSGRVLGTYVHGPLLPKNPWLADWLIEQALERRYGPVTLEPLDDALEQRAHDAAAEISRRR
jgi:lipid II isoglutaminyl synthase (glutamine-hydrolysing)